MPPPVPRWSCAVLDPERADGDVEVARAGGRRRPSRPRRSRRPRATGSSAAMCSQGRELRRAGDRARRERGGEQLGPADARRAAGPRTVRHQVDEAGVLLDRAQRRAPSTEPALAHPAEVVADEVDDHHVLGAVLRRGSPSAVGGGALDRATTDHGRRRGARKRSGDADATWHAVRRAAGPPRAYGAGLPSASAAPRAATSAPGGSGARQPAGEVDLVHVAGRDRRRGWRATPAANAASVERASSTPSAGGPRHGRPGPGPGRADVGEAGAAPARPSNGSTTAQKPGAVERGEVVGDVDQVGQPAGRRRRRGAASAATAGHGGSVRSRLGTAARADPPGRPSHRARRAHRRARGVPQGGARLRRGARSRRTPRRGTATTRSRSTPCWRWASSGCSASRSPRSTAAAGDFTTLCIAIEELGPGRPVDGDHARGRRRPRAPTRSTVRHRGAEAALAARPVRRAGARRLRPHRARRRQRRRRHPHARPCSTRPPASG